MPQLHPLSPEAYAREVELVVMQFQRRLSSPRNHCRRGVHGGVPAIVEALRHLGRPVAYDEIIAEMGLPNTEKVRWEIAGRLRHLTKLGYIREAGRISRCFLWHYKGYNISRPMPVTLFEYQSSVTELSSQRACEWLEKKMDLLDQRLALGRCVISGWSFVSAGRNQQIIADYVRGKTCAEIGRELGITRERVRQIVAYSVNRRRRFDEQTQVSRG